MSSYYSRDFELSGSGSYGPSSGSYVSGNYTSGNYLSLDSPVTVLEGVDKSLTCSVCHCRFKDPRVLNCSHTFCKVCLEKMLAYTQQPREECTTYPRLSICQICCPKCREITRLGHGGIDTLPSNYELVGVIDAMPPEATDVQQFARQQSVPTCPLHNKELAYYCSIDRSLVCGDCLVDKAHRGHDQHHSKADKMFEEEKDKFHENHFEVLEKERQRFKQAAIEVTHAISSLREKGETTREEIQRHFQELCDQLVEREEKLVKQAQKIVAEKVDKLLVQEKQLKEIVEGLDSEYEQCKRLMESTPIDFLHSKDKLIAKTSAMMHRASGIERSPVELSQTGPYWHHPSSFIQDTETTCGVYCDPEPSMYTATGVGLVKAFLGREASFKIEVRDKYGNRSFKDGASPKVTIQGPGGVKHVSCKVDQSKRGEYTVTYSPSQVGWHFMSIKVNGEAIKKSEFWVIVFGQKDYLMMKSPLERVSKSQFNFDPPVSTMRGVCMLPNGWIVFVDSSCVRVIDAFTGKTRQTIGVYGNGQGQFSSPYGITVTPQNHIFVTDILNHRVQRFAPDGANFRYRYVSGFGTQGANKQSLNGPEGIAALGDDRVYIADKGNNRIQVISQKTMKHQTTIGKKGDGAGQFNHPRDVYVTSNFLLVSDSGNRRIQALGFDGKPLRMFGGYNYLVFKPRTPSFIAVDPDGFMLITYKESSHITVLTPQGDNKVVTQLDSSYLKSPFGICLYSGNVVVTDSSVCHILSF